MPFNIHHWILSALLVFLNKFCAWNHFMLNFGCISSLVFTQGGKFHQVPLVSFLVMSFIETRDWGTIMPKWRRHRRDAGKGLKQKFWENWGMGRNLKIKIFYKVRSWMITWFFLRKLTLYLLCRKDVSLISGGDTNTYLLLVKESKMHNKYAHFYVYRKK